MPAQGARGCSDGIPSPRFKIWWADCALASLGYGVGALGVSIGTGSLVPVDSVGDTQGVGRCGLGVAPQLVAAYANHLGSPVRVGLDQSTGGPCCTPTGLFLKLWRGASICVQVVRTRCLYTSVEVAVRFTG